MPSDDFDSRQPLVPPGTPVVLKIAVLQPYGVDTKLALPVEPLYDIGVVADLIPCTEPALRSILYRWKKHFLPRYRLDGQRRRRRLLSADEVKFIRLKILRGPGKEHYTHIP